MPTFTHPLHRLLARWALPVFCALAWSATFFTHFRYGLNIEISTFLEQLFLLSCCALGVRYMPPKWVWICVGSFVVLVFLRPSQSLQTTLSIIPAALVFLMFFSIGVSLHRHPRWRIAFAWALLLAFAINVFAAMVQWMKWEIVFHPLVAYSPELWGARAIGNIAQPNQLAFFFVVCIVVLERVASHLNKDSSRSTKCSWVVARNAAMILVYVFAIVGISLTQSRMAFGCGPIQNVASSGTCFLFHCPC
jgi:hypothetical protein